MQPYFIEPLIEEEDQPRPNWKRRILISVVCVVGLLVAGWLVVSSEMFLREVVMKKVGRSINAEITFKSADWSPARSVVLQGVRIKAVGQEPFWEAKEIMVNYQLRNLLAGKIDFSDITIVEPVISVHMDAEGKTNLDSLFKQSGKRVKPGEPSRLRIGRLILQQSTLDFHRQFHSGSEERMRLTHLEIRGENIGNELAGKLNITAGMQYALHRKKVPGQVFHPNARSAIFFTEAVDKLEGTLSFECDQELDLNWLPKSVTARAKILVVESRGQFAFANGLEASLESHLTPAEVKNFQLNFQHEGNLIGNLMLGGSMDIQNGSADLQMAVKGIERHVLNFVGRPYDIDFHDTVLSSTNRLLLGGFGEQIELRGALSATPLQMSLGSVKLPSVDVAETQYDFRVDMADKRIIFDLLSLKATHKAKQFLAGEINQPMTVSWGGDMIEAPDSEFELEVTNTDMADWQPLLGRYAKSGAMAGNVKIGVKKNGSEVRFGSSGSITSLQLPLNGKVIEIGDFNLSAEGEVTEFQKLNFTQFAVEAIRSGKNYFKYEGKSGVDIAAKTVAGTGKFEGDLPVLLSWFPQQGVNCKEGRVEYAGSFSANLRRPQSQSIEGTLKVRNMQATIREKTFTNFTGTAEVKLRLDEGHRLHISSLNANGYLNEKRLATQVYTTGTWHLRDGSAKLDVVVVKDLDLSLLKTVLPMKGISNGRVDAILKAVVHNPGEKITAVVSVNIRRGEVKGWPSSVNLDGSGNVEMAWLDRGQIIQVGDMHVKSLNKENLKWIDAELTADAKFNDRTGVFEITLKSSEWGLPLLHPLLATHLNGVELLEAKISHSAPVILRGNGQGAFEIKGPLKVERVRLKDSKGMLPEGLLAADAILDLKFTQPFIPGWGIEAKKTTASFLLGDRNAGKISFVGAHHSSPLAGNFDVTVENMDHDIASLILGSSADQVRMVAGRIVSLKSKGAYDAKKEADSLNIRLDTLIMKLKGADIHVKSGYWPAGVMDINYELEDAKFSLGDDLLVSKSETNKLNVNQNGVEVASLNMKLSVKDSGKKFSIKSLDLIPPFTSLGLKKWLPNQGVQAGRLTVNDSELRLDPKGNGHFKGNIKLRGFTLPSDIRNGKPTQLDGRFEIDAGVTNNVYSIERFLVDLPRTAKTENVGMISGHVDLSNPSAPSGKIQFYSDALDITPLIAFLKTSHFRTGENTVVKPEPNFTPLTPEQRQKPSNQMSFYRFEADMDVRKIYYRELVATDVTGKVKLNDAMCMVKYLNAQVGGGAVVCNINVDRSHDNNATFSVKVSKVNLGQLNLGDQADFNGTVSGTINARTHGNSRYELLKNISGEAVINAQNPSIAVITAINLAIPQIGLIEQLMKIIPSLVKDIEKIDIPNLVTSLAVKLSDLRIDQIEYSKSTWQASAGVLSLKEGLVQVEEGKHWYKIYGTLGLGYSLPNTPINYIIDAHWPAEVLRIKSITGLKALDSLLNAANKTIDITNFYSVGGSLGQPVRKLNRENILKALTIEALPLPFDLFKLLP